MHRYLALLLIALNLAACAFPRTRPEAHSHARVVDIHGLAAAQAAQIVDAEITGATDVEAVRRAVASISGQSGVPFVEGNHVKLLVDGPQTIAAIRESIATAQHHIHVETYIFADDQVGRAFRDLLIERRRAGVEVRVIYDAVGSVTTPGEFFDVMRRTGIEVLEFRPLDPVHTPLPWRVNNRDHRKLVVVDGHTAFTGGINISSTYAASSSRKPGPEAGVDQAWRDTHVRIDGPVVRQFQRLFLETWTRLGGEVDLTQPQFYPELESEGSELVAAVSSEGGDPDSSGLYGTFLAAIRNASTRLWITQAYFAPNQEFRQALIDAVKRGVDVRLIVPGFTDSKLVLYAARSTYDELLRGGVRIFEQRYALLHAKTLVSDRALSMVGSANFDIRSFVHNNEIDAVIVSSDFADDMEQLFAHDMHDAHELTWDEWRKRSFGEKAKEQLSRLFHYWL
jgi:cardiolipin synthase